MTTLKIGKKILLKLINKDVFVLTSTKENRVLCIEGNLQMQRKSLTVLVLKCTQTTLFLKEIFRMGKFMVGGEE